MAFVVAAAARECLLRFERFEAVVRALHGAGVPLIADGAWALEHGAWGPPGWDGEFVVPSHSDVIVSLLAALGYRPLFAVDPDIYVDPERRHPCTPHGGGWLH
jgi:hypothetical protein